MTFVVCNSFYEDRLMKLLKDNAIDYFTITPSAPPVVAKPCWQEMSEIAIAAIQSLDKISNGSLPLSYARNMIMLRSFLSDVVTGGSPLVDRDGNIIVPELPQRRVLKRKPVYLRAILEHKGKASPVIVINISTTGVALENAPPLVPKSVVVLEIGERCFAGMVVWDRGSSAAIKFDMPLKEEDPLLA